MSIFDNNITTLLPQEAILKEIRLNVASRVIELINIPNDYPETYDLVYKYVFDYICGTRRFSKYFALPSIYIEKIRPYYLRRIFGKPCLHITIIGSRYLTPEEDSSLLNPARETLIDMKV